VRGKPDWPSDQCGSFDFPHGVHENGDCVSNGLQLGVGLQSILGLYPRADVGSVKKNI
jgi:hypothetical protein